MAKSKRITTNVDAASQVGRDRKTKPSAESAEKKKNLKAMSLRQLRELGYAAAEEVVDADAKWNAHRDVVLENRMRYAF